MNHSVTKILSSLLTQILLVSWVLPYPTVEAFPAHSTNSYLKQETLISSHSMPVYQAMQLSARLDQIWTRVKKLESISKFGPLRPSTRRSLNKYLVDSLKNAHLFIVEGGLLVQTQEISLLVSDLKTITPDPIHLKSGAYLHIFADVTGDTTIKKAMRNPTHSDPIRSRVSSLYDTGGGVLGNGAKGDLDSTHIDERIAIALRSESPLGPILVIPSVLSAGMKFLEGNIEQVGNFNAVLDLAQLKINAFGSDTSSEVTEQEAGYSLRDAFTMPRKFIDGFSKLSDEEQNYYSDTVMYAAWKLYEKAESVFPGNRNRDFIQLLEDDQEGSLGKLEKIFYKNLKGPYIIISAKEGFGANIYLKRAAKRKFVKRFLTHERFHTGLDKRSDAKVLSEMYKIIDKQLAEDRLFKYFFSLWEPRYQKSRSDGNEFWTQLYFPSVFWVLKYHWLPRMFINFSRWIIVRVARLKVERILESTEEGRGFLKTILEIQKLAKEEGEKDFVALDKSPLNQELGLVNDGDGTSMPWIKACYEWIVNRYRLPEFLEPLWKDLEKATESDTFQASYRSYTPQKINFNLIDQFHMRFSDLWVKTSTGDHFGVQIYYKKMPIIDFLLNYQYEYETPHHQKVPRLEKIWFHPNLDNGKQTLKDKLLRQVLLDLKAKFASGNQLYWEIAIALPHRISDHWEKESSYWEQLGVFGTLDGGLPYYLESVSLKGLIELLNNPDYRKLSTEAKHGIILSEIMPKFIYTQFPSKLPYVSNDFSWEEKEELMLDVEPSVPTGSFIRFEVSSIKKDGPHRIYIVQKISKKRIRIRQIQGGSFSGYALEDWATGLMQIENRQNLEAGKTVLSLPLLGSDPSDFSGKRTTGELTSIQIDLSKTVLSSAGTFASFGRPRGIILDTALNDTGNGEVDINRATQRLLYTVLGQHLEEHVNHLGIEIPDADIGLLTRSTFSSRLIPYVVDRLEGLILPEEQSTYHDEYWVDFVHLLFSFLNSKKYTFGMRGDDISEIHEQDTLKDRAVSLFLLARYIDLVQNGFFVGYFDKYHDSEKAHPIGVPIHEVLRLQKTEDNLDALSLFSIFLFRVKERIKESDDPFSVGNMNETIDEMLIKEYSDLGAWKLSDLSDDQLYTLVERTGKEEAAWDIKRLSELQDEDTGRVVKAGNMDSDSGISHVYEHFRFSPELNSLFRNALVQRTMRIIGEARKKRPTLETIFKVDSKGSSQEPQKGIGRITTRIPVTSKRERKGNGMAEDKQLVVRNSEVDSRGVVVAYFGGDLNLPVEEGFTHILLIPKDQGETMWLSSYVAQVSYEDWVLKGSTSIVDLDSLSRNAQNILGIQISSLIKTPSISKHTPRTGASIVVIDLLSSLKAIGHIVDRMNIRDEDLQKKFKEMIRGLVLDLAA